MARLGDERLSRGDTTPSSTSSRLPSETPATSVTNTSRRSRGKGRSVVLDSSEDEALEAAIRPLTKKLKTGASGSRRTPRRVAALRTSGTFTPVLDIGTDDEDDDDDGDPDLSYGSAAEATSKASRSTIAKGKRRAITSESEAEFDPVSVQMGSDDSESEMASALALIHELEGGVASQTAQAAARRAAQQIMASSSGSLVLDKGIERSMRKMVSGTKKGGKPVTKAAKAKSAAQTSRTKKRKVRETSESDESDEFIVDSESVIDSDDQAEESSALSAVSEAESEARPKSKKKSKAAKSKPKSDETKEERKARRERENERRSKTRGMPQWQKTQTVLEEHHPELVDFWDKTEAVHAVVKPQAAEQPDGLFLKLMPFQLEGLHWMKLQESGPWKGGLQSDEMGMGKTIQSIALILSDHDPHVKRHTLVVAPTVAIMQWRNEFNKHTNCFKVLVWHGASRSNDTTDLKKFDVILTSYAVLESTFRRQHSGFKKNGELHKEPSAMHRIKWHRVILDEAHNIKDRSCNTARGAFALRSTYRWCLTGTPLMNRVGELYSMVRYLQLDPMAYYFCKKCKCRSMNWAFTDKRTCDDCGHSPMHHTCLWNQEILKPIMRYGHEGQGAVAFGKLRILMDRLMLRRTKLERADDLGLPPRTVVVRRDHFTEEEEELYASLFKDVKRKFSTFVDDNTVLNNYSSIFTLITRMRQMALHPDMVLKSRTAGGISQALAEAAQIDPIHTCRICLDEADDPIVSKCRHVYCRQCVSMYIETAAAPDCIVCHLPLSIDLEQPALEEGDAGAVAKTRQGMLDRIDPSKWRTSSKIEALVEELSMLRSEDSIIKSLVFSQFTSFLDLIARRLQLAGFKYVRLQGSMTPEARDRTIKYFTETTDCTVFLLSLKAGGVALNLVEASRVFVMDPWWNPGVELQAMDRVHRIGQRRPVIITRIIIQNSIEAQIIELQKKKESMIGAALGDEADAMARLTPEDLSFLFSS